MWYRVVSPKRASCARSQALEVSEYDQLLQGFQRASVTTEVIGATLNAGQSIVLAGGLTAVLVVASLTGTSMTAGDLVRCPGSLHPWVRPLSRMFDSALILTPLTFQINIGQEHRPLHTD